MEKRKLPKGWEWRKLGDKRICSLNPPAKEVKDLPDTMEVSFVPMNAIDDFSGTILTPQVKPLGAVRRGYTYFRNGDVVFAKITPCMENGKSAVARKLENGIGFGTTELHVLRPGPLLTAEWLHTIIRDIGFRNAARESMCGGAGQQRVPVNFLKKIEIPLPPLPEQERIVARIEEMTGRMEEARRLREEAEREVEILLRSIVSDVIEDGKRKGWISAKIIKVCEKPQYGLTEKAKYSANGPKFLRITDIQNGDVEWDRVPFCNCVNLGKYRLIDGDILFARTGATTGKSYLVKNPPVAVFASYLIRLRPKPGIIPEYLAWFFRSRDYWREVNSGTEDGNRPNMNGTKLGKIEIVYPKDKDEQIRIVDYLEKKQHIIKQLNITMRDSAIRIDLLSNSLIAKAFRGEL